VLLCLTLAGVGVGMGMGQYTWSDGTSGTAPAAADLSMNGPSNPFDGSGGLSENDSV
jgi:hypothetical protein